MTLTASDIERLCMMGNSVKVTADGTLFVRPVASAAAKLSGAERARRFRQRQKDGSVTHAVTAEPGSVTYVTDVTHVTHDEKLHYLPPIEEKNSTEEVPQKGNSAKTATKQALRVTEAERTSKLPLPADLDTDAFRAAWAEFCRHRSAVAAGNSKAPWTELARNAILRECSRNGEAWAIVELNTAIGKGWQAPYWDQRRNPADVRSQPLLPNGNHRPTHRPTAIVTRNTEPLPDGRPSLNATAAGGLPAGFSDAR